MEAIGEVSQRCGDAVDSRVHDNTFDVDVDPADFVLVLQENRRRGVRD